LILRKIIKIAATRCHILKPKCTKFDHSRVPPDPLAGFKGRGRGWEREGKVSSS